MYQFKANGGFGMMHQATKHRIDESPDKKEYISVKDGKLLTMDVDPDEKFPLLKGFKKYTPIEKDFFREFTSKGYTGYVTVLKGGSRREIIHVKGPESIKLVATR